MVATARFYEKTLWFVFDMLYSNPRLNRIRLIWIFAKIG